MDPDLDELESCVAAVARATKPNEIFRLLLDGGALGAPRVAILLHRDGSLRGWGCLGYPDPAASRLRALDVASDDTWLARALSSGESATRRAGQHGPDFGQPPAVEAWAFPVRVGTRAVAVLLAERSGDDPLVNRAVLEILTTVARLRLEVDLAWRRSQGKAAASTSDHRPAEKPAMVPVTVEVGLAPAVDPTEHVDQARRREARTFARLVATDIRLYNEEAVMLGRRHRDLGRRLREHLEKGKESFRRRFPDLGDDGLLLLDDAYIQVLAAGDPALLTTV